MHQAAKQIDGCDLAALPAVRILDRIRTDEVALEASLPTSTFSKSPHPRACGGLECVAFVVNLLRNYCGVLQTALQNQHNKMPNEAHVARVCGHLVGALCNAECLVEATRALAESESEVAHAILDSLFVDSSSPIAPPVAAERGE